MKDICVIHDIVYWGVRFTPPPLDILENVEKNEPAQKNGKKTRGENLFRRKAPKNVDHILRQNHCVLARGARNFCIPRQKNDPARNIWDDLQKKWPRTS